MKKSEKYFSDFLSIETPYYDVSTMEWRIYNTNLNDWLPIITIIIPDWLIWISSRVDFVVEVVITRPWRSMMVYLVSGAVSM